MTGRASTLVVSGRPGTGKSRLLHHGAETARSRGFTVFSGLPDWLRAPAGHGAESLVDRSLELAVPGGAPRRSARTDGVNSGRATRAFTGHGLTLVTVDDFQFSDRDEIHTLRSLLRSFRRYPILWFLTVCQPGNTDLPIPLIDGMELEVLPDLTPLDGDDLRSLVSDVLGADPSDELCGLLEGIGDPGPIVELVRGLVEDGSVIVSDGTAGLCGTGESADPFPGSLRGPDLPKRYVAAFRAKLDLLSPESRRLLQVAAVLGRHVLPDSVAAMLALSPADLLPPAESVIRQGLLTAEDDSLVFRNDYVRDAVLRTVATPLRLMLHREAARIMVDRYHDHACAAAHLARGARPGDTDAVELLNEVSAQLLATDPSGAADLAIRGLHLAAGTAHGGHGGLAVTAVRSLIQQGCLARALSLAEDVLSTMNSDPATTAALQLWRSLILLLSGRTEEASVLARSLLTGDCESDTRNRAELVQLGVEALTDERAARERASAISSMLIRGVPAAEVSTAAATIVSMDRLRAGRITEALDGALDGAESDLCADCWFLSPPYLRAHILIRLGRVAEAEAVIGVLDRVGRTGSRAAAIAATALRATARLARGSLDEARAAAAEALEAARTHEMPLFAPHVCAVLATVALHQGNLVAARRYLGNGAELIPWERSRPWWAQTLLTSARLATATTGAAAGINTLKPVLLQDPDLWREVLLEDPAAAGWLVRTAREAGAHEMADAAVAASDSLSADNPAFPSLRSSALHARGLLDRDAELLRRARSQFSDPMSKANAAEDLGAVLLDVDRAASIDHLDEAHAQYGALGATWHTARVNRALRSLGVRRRSWKYAKRPLTGWESLTATERKVADLIAEGLTNKQAASHLFVSSHTVGFHLRQIYRKLNVRSRTELVRDISGADAAASPPCISVGVPVDRAQPG